MKKKKKDKERPVHLTAGPGMPAPSDLGRCGQRKNKDSVCDDLSQVTCLNCLRAFAQKCQGLLDSIARNAARPR